MLKGQIQTQIIYIIYTYIYIHVVCMCIYHNPTSWFDTEFFRTRGFDSTVIISGQAWPLGRKTYGVTSLNTEVPPVTKVTVPNSWLLETGIVPLSYINWQLGHELKPEIRENTKFWEWRHFRLLHTPPSFVKLFSFFWHLHRKHASVSFTALWRRKFKLLCLILKDVAFGNIWMESNC